jgi:hypothetical protein
VTQPSSEFVVYGQDAASYLGLTGAAHGVLADLDAAHLHPFAATELAELQTSLFHIDALQELHQLFTLHHGNWCGPGHLGTAEIDLMDSYCHVHDNTYDALGVTSGGAGSNPAVSMWSRAGFQATVEADEALVQSVSQLTGLDGQADWYRDNIIRIFSTRAHIGRLLRRLPFQDGADQPRSKAIMPYLPSPWRAQPPRHRLFRNRVRSRRSLLHCRVTRDRRADRGLAAEAVVRGHTQVHRAGSA